MKLRSVGLLCVAIVLGLAGSAFAEYGFTFSFEYTGSYTADWMEGTVFPEADAAAPGGMLNRTLMLPIGNTYTIHEYQVYITLTDLAVGEDVTGIQVVGAVGGAVTQDNLNEAANKNDYSIDPPLMGGSNAPAASWDTVILFNSTPAMGFSMRMGSASGTGGNKYGDYAAFMQLGEAAPFFLGTCYYHTPEGNVGLTDPAVDKVTWSPQNLKTIRSNADGVGTSTTDAYRSGYAFYGDVMSFKVVPEPSSLALLGCSLFGLLAYAWRKRK